MLRQLRTTKRVSVSAAITTTTVVGTTRRVLHCQMRWTTKAAAEKAGKSGSTREVGTLYKCWAQDAAERSLILDKILSLQADGIDKAQSRSRAHTMS